MPRPDPQVSPRRQRHHRRHDPATGALRPQYQAYLERRRAVLRGAQETIDDAKRLLPILRAHAGEAQPAR